MKFYQLDNKALEKELETNLVNGLTKEQAQQRFNECGYNVQIKSVKDKTTAINPVCFVLLICVCLAYALSALFTKNISYLYYSLAFFSVFAISQVIIFTVNYFVNKELNNSFLNSSAILTVIRDGNEISIRSCEIMYGDIVLIKKGDYIPFDGVIISSKGLVTDETDVGGKDICSKRQGIILEDNVPMTQLYNTVFCGSYVVHGEAKIVVTDVCARVYSEKSGVLNKRQSRFNSKIIDISTIFSTIFVLFCLIFSVVCGLISQDAVSVITFIILMLSLMFSGYIKTISLIIYKKAYINLNKKGIYLKSFNKINSINKVDVLLLDSSILYKDDVELSSFVDSEDKIYNISDVSKKTVKTFLYTALCLDNRIAEKCDRILNKCGINIEEISSLYPSLLVKDYDDIGIRVCARAFDGTNTLFAVGNYTSVVALCNNSLSDNSISKLSQRSNEILAVAIKTVDQIPSDLSVKLNNFTLVGAIGVNKSKDYSVYNSIKLLNNCGIKVITLFPGKDDLNVNAVSAADFISLTKEQVKNVDAITNFDGNINNTVSFLSKHGFFAAFIGCKSKNDDKVLNFAVQTDNQFELKNADIVIDRDYKVFESFYETRKANYLLNQLFEKSTLLFAFYNVIGVLFSLLYKELLISPIIFALLFFICVPLAIFLRMYFNVSFKKISLKNNSDYPLSSKTVSSILLSILLFIFVCVVSKFIFNYQISAMFLVISFITYLFIDFDGKKNIFLSTAISAVFPLILSIILSTPMGAILNITPINFGLAVVAVALGIGFKLLFDFIYKKLILK